MTQEPQPCETCSALFSTMYHVEGYDHLHVDKHSCGICSETFRTLDEYTCHTRIHISAQQFTRAKSEPSSSVKDSILQNCSQYAFNQIKRIGRTIFGHENLDIKKTRRQHKCKFCNLFFTNLSTLKTHELTHNVKPFNCRVCNKTFVLTGRQFREHMKTHSDSKRFQCTVCQKTYFTLRGLNHHSNECLKVIKKGHYACDLCSKTFPTFAEYKHHRRIHATMKPYKCEQCAQCFAKSAELILHRKCHSGGRPYKCKACRKSFVYKATLETHSSSCSRKPSKCEICSKSFAYHQLRKHRLSHTGEKPYQCTICQKRFSINYNLRIHERLHSGEKPFRCEICSSQFRVKCLLKWHTEKVHPSSKT